MAERYKAGCKLAGPGRGDCFHFIGLPESVEGKPIDEYGIPLGWCDYCWLHYKVQLLKIALKLITL